MRTGSWHWLPMAMIVTVLGMSLGCASTFREIGAFETQRYDDQSYTKTLRDKKGQVILEIEVEYLGKAPQGEIEEYINPCWEKLDADFWDIHFNNLSNQAIVLTEWIYLHSGTLSKNKNQEKRVAQQMGPDGIKQLLGSNIIYPGQSLLQHNSHICADQDTISRETRKGIRLIHKGKTYQVEIPQRYLR